MSASRKNIYASVPFTNRGQSVHLAGDPKGDNFVYACGNSIIIRSLKDPLQAHMYSQHSCQTTVARWAPSGFYIASGDVHGNVRVWDTTNMNENILKFECRPISGAIRDLAWSEDSKRIVAVGEGRERFGAVFMWDSGSSVGEITGHSKTLLTCDFKPSRPYRVVTGGEDFTACWFEGPPFKFKKSLSDHSRFVTCTRFSPNGEKVATVGLDKKGIIWDGKTGDKLVELNGHTLGVYSVSWSPDSQQLITASADKTVKLWDAASGQCLTTFDLGRGSNDVGLQQLGCLWHREYLVSVGLNGHIFYLDRDHPNEPRHVIKGHNKFVTALAADVSRGHVYTGSYDSVVTRWDIATGASESLAGNGHSNQIQKLKVAGDTLVSAAMDDSLRFNSVNTASYGDAVSTDSSPQDVAVSRQDPSLTVAVTLKSVVVLRNGRTASTLNVGFQPTSVAISPDNRTVAVGAKDTKVYIYALNGDNLSQTRVLEKHRGGLTAVEFSPNGEFLATSDSEKRDIIVWNTSDYSVKVEGWCFHTAAVRSIAWTEDSLKLASGSLDQDVYIWNLNHPSKRIHIPRAHQGGVNAVAWLDDITLATAGQDMSWKTWSVTHL
jgi:WD40 repeat protein